MTLDTKYNIGETVCVDGRQYYKYIVTQICYNGDSIDYQLSYTENGPTVHVFWVGESRLSYPEPTPTFGDVPF